jgi:MAF protein
MDRLILASGSPRRQALLRLLDYPVQVVVPNVDENAINVKDPSAYVQETARRKAAVVARTTAQTQVNRPFTPGEKVILVAADTTVALNGEMLGKPASANEARQMLQRLRDRSHVVYTGLVVQELGMGKTAAGVHAATVTMRPYTNQEIEAYIASGDPFDKAGAYAIQHPLFNPVSQFEGCYLGIVGLSICHLIELMHHVGVSPRVDLPALLRAHQGAGCPILEKASGER